MKTPVAGMLDRLYQRLITAVAITVAVVVGLRLLVAWLVPLLPLLVGALGLLVVYHWLFGPPTRRHH